MVEDQIPGKLVPVVELHFDALRRRYRESVIPSELISRFGEVQGATDGAVIATFTAGAGVTQGSWADVLHIEAGVTGQAGAHAKVSMEDTRHGTLAVWPVTNPNLANGSYSWSRSEDGFVRNPLYAGVRGTFVVRGYGATTSSFSARVAAILPDRDGSAAGNLDGFA